jgi:DNA repair protein RAD51
MSARLSHAAVPLGGFRTATEVYQQQSHLAYISTGSKQLDALLGGGIEGGALTEVFGGGGVGKTQLCHTLAVTCQLPWNQGGGAGKCVYIDAAGTFRPQRLCQIAQHYALDPQIVMDNIMVVRPYNTNHQDLALTMAGQLMSESTFSLLIVDAPMLLYDSDYPKTHELRARQGHLGRFLGTLRRLANSFGIAVVITNQVRFDPNVVNPDQPLGGNVMAHGSTTRLHFQRVGGEIRTCEICSSPSIAQTRAHFSVLFSGISDPVQQF